MAIKEIKVSTTRLGNDADQVGNLIRSMENELKNLKASVDQMNAMWDGPAKKAFMAAVQSDVNVAESIIKELKSFQKNETEAKKKYEQCESQIDSIINSIRV